MTTKPADDPAPAATRPVAAAISDEAVEAASRAGSRDVYPQEDYDEAGPHQREIYRRRARIALTAALPHLTPAPTSGPVPVVTYDEQSLATMAWMAFLTPTERAEIGTFDDLPPDEQIRWQSVAYHLRGTPAAPPPPAAPGLDDFAASIDQLLEKGGADSSITIRRGENHPYACDYTNPIDGDWMGVGDTPVDAVEDLYDDMFLK